jgi:hypothetical protein
LRWWRWWVSGEPAFQTPRQLPIFCGGWGVRICNSAGSTATLARVRLCETCDMGLLCCLIGFFNLFGAHALRAKFHRPHARHRFH